MIRRLLLATTLVTSAACDVAPTPDEARAATPAPAPAAVPSPVVDSILPPDEALRRFRAGLAAPAALTGAAATRDELVRRFIAAVEQRDTTALRDMVLDRAEFAYLYFPGSRFTRPPLRTAPELVWFLTQQNSEKGIGRVLQRHGGRSLGYAGYHCEPEPTREGANLLWERCVVRRVAAPGDTTTHRLFGTILQRGGRFAFVSYASEM